MTFEVRTPRGTLAAPSADEVAALVAALAAVADAPAPEPPARSRWREAARRFDDEAAAFR